MRPMSLRRICRRTQVLWDSAYMPWTIFYGRQFKHSIFTSQVVAEGKPCLLITSKSMDTLWLFTKGVSPRLLAIGTDPKSLY